MSKTSTIYSIQLSTNALFDPDFSKNYRFYFPIDRTFIHSKAADKISPTAFKMFVLLQDHAYTTHSSCMELDPTTLLSCREHVENVLSQLQQYQLLTFSKIKENKVNKSKGNRPEKEDPIAPTSVDAHSLVHEQAELTSFSLAQDPKVKLSVVQKRKRKVPKEKEIQAWTDAEILHTKANEKPKLGADQLVGMWKYFVPNLPAPKKLTPAREKLARKLVENYTPEEIEAALKNINDSEFCNGKNDRHWKASFDFFLNENKFVKILEGDYNNRKPKTSDNPEAKTTHRTIDLDSSFK